MVTSRKGCTSPTRRNSPFVLAHESAAARLILRVRRWIEIARGLKARRLLIDGSFVTATTDPNDVDAVMLLPSDFQSMIEEGNEEALELETMLLTRRPEEIFAAEDDHDWDEWVDFFSRTHETDGRHKGLVEIQL